MTASQPLRDPVDDVRIRSGQRKLIFAVAAKVGLRDEQLHDLVESGSDYRTRTISHLTIREARRVIGLLKTLERNQARIRAQGGPAGAAPSDAMVRQAVRRAAAARPA